MKGGYEISRFYTLVDALTNTSENQNLDSWERFITDTRRTYRREGIFTPAVEDIISHTMMSNDEKILSLLKTYFEPDDYFLVYKRMIGTGTGKCGPHRICQHYEYFRSGIPQAARTWIQR